jgi:hypothetical protein
MTPDNASPVLKKLITIQLDGAFSGTLTESDLTVTLVSTTDSTYVRYTNVVAVDNTLKTITIKYGGAKSGAFSLSVMSVSYGKFDTTGIVFTAKGTITAISPTSGSVYGGTLVTITGENFGDIITDNPVKIGETYCYVVTTSSTSITCRTSALNPSADVA